MWHRSGRTLLIFLEATSLELVRAVVGQQLLAHRRVRDIDHALRSGCGRATRALR
jgi:hypothetical protein